MGWATTTFEQRAKWGIFAMFTPSAVAIVAATWFIHIHQEETYHLFADQRTILGIANFWNVMSNLAFAIVGLMGLHALRDLHSRMLFGGIFLVAIGSAYYHLAPDTPRLVWDRLPMTIAFMSLLAIVLGEKTWKLLVLLAVGVASIVWWRVTGNLAPYALVQFGPVVILIGMLIAGRLRGLWPVVVLYGLAKLAEFSDAEVYASFPLSGHTLKHLLAAAATYFIWRWRVRQNDRPPSSALIERSI